ncbi:MULTISPECIES: DNA-binding protein [unclassified Methylobacterium]|uniref:DNA-binding protein n=1 Tax=unclassified Methylobacterium TaxID=2615210 RepID=UPI001353DA22|nr:DNA-binding protein [Methylobacterium sp. 2A]MWV25373.1 DNA-binding protein [Methylobacterium sp. 2A]
MTDDKTIDGTAREIPGPAKPTHRVISRRTWVVGALAAPLAMGALGLSLAQGTSFQPTPVEPVAIQALAPSGATAIRGTVAEIFGNKFVVQDPTGRALVETGREGEDGTLVAKGEAVTVQGRFETGFLHASVLTHGDGRTILLGPAGGPPMGSLDWAKDRIGLGPKPDLPALTAAVQAAGYSDVRVTGRGPRHLEVAAKDRDGREHQLHVGFDGQVREQPVPPRPPV